MKADSYNEQDKFHVKSRNVLKSNVCNITNFKSIITTQKNDIL